MRKKAILMLGMTFIGVAMGGSSYAEEASTVSSISASNITKNVLDYKTVVGHYSGRKTQEGELSAFDEQVKQALKEGFSLNGNPVISQGLYDGYNEMLIVQSLIKYEETERKVIDYQLLGDRQEGDLSDKVKKYLNSGWYLYGSSTANMGEEYQAVVKYATAPRDKDG
ncbi:DUF1737 domain-containing protein [Acetobacteraceae bacterium]|nr:DUF1737 domain-containing protein [Acetobacteraceae bacterium]